MFKPLYKLSTDGVRINQWTVEVEDDKYRTISGFVGMKQTTSEWTVCTPKNEGKSNETTAEQQALAEATSMYDKRKEKGYFDDITKVNIKLYVEPMLAHKYEDKKSKLTFPLISDQKLDGIRCIVTADGMKSRNGKAILSAPHIYNALKPLFDTRPDLVLDGELYADKLANDFNKICSLVKKTKPKLADIMESAEKIEYHVYDCPSCDGRTSNRKKYIKALLDGLNPKIKIVEGTLCHTQQELDDLYEQYVDQGYEGQMIRVPDAPYENKRSKFLLKRKEFITEEYTITGVYEGQGNKSKMVGYMTFNNKDGKQFKSNVKAPWPELIKMWKCRVELIGMEATIRYFNMTPGDNPVPRFPYVIEIDRWY